MRETKGRKKKGISGWRDHKNFNFKRMSSSLPNRQARRLVNAKYKGGKENTTCSSYFKLRMDLESTVLVRKCMDGQHIKEHMSG